MTLLLFPLALLLSSLSLVTSDCSNLNHAPKRTDLCKLCHELPEHLLDCEDVLDLSEYNKTYQDTFIKENDYGCKKMGGEAYEDVEVTRVVCRPIDTFTCYWAEDNNPILNEETPGLEKEEKRFLSEFKKPCIRYTGHYFQSTLIYSILLGFLGVDRFCLGWTGIGVGKMLTVGGLGIWWVIDIILLITGNLTPNDRSNWETLY